MVKICQTGLLKLKFLYQKNAFSGFCQKISQAMDEAENFFCQYPNPWAFKVSGMGCHTSKCQKKIQNHCTLMLSILRRRCNQNLKWTVYILRRYKDISPYDSTRVVLTECPTGDYINANHVRMEVAGSGLVNRYIATQVQLIKSVFRIRIHLIRIRIQSFNDQNVREKFPAGKKITFFHQKLQFTYL